MGLSVRPAPQKKRRMLGGIWKGCRRIIGGYFPLKKGSGSTGKNIERELVGKGPFSLRRTLVVWAAKDKGAGMWLHGEASDGSAPASTASPAQGLSPKLRGEQIRIRGKALPLAEKRSEANLCPPSFPKQRRVERRVGGHLGRPFSPELLRVCGVCPSWAQHPTLQ